MEDQTKESIIDDDEFTKLRPVHCELNPMSRSDGSALFSQGGTCVIACMAGPVDGKMQHMKIDKAHVEISFRPKVGMQTPRDKLRESIVKDICESAIICSIYPRSVIGIQMQELEDRGGMEACAINAACMALVIGGIPLKHTVAAVHCAIQKSGKLILDPDIFQTDGRLAAFTFVFESIDQNMVSIFTEGQFNINQLHEAHNYCRSASLILFDFYRKLFSDFHSKSFLTSSSSKFKLTTDQINNDLPKTATETMET